MRNQLGYFVLMFSMLAGGCSSSHDQPVDGQTHWMERCTDDDECGELSCLCGVCTDTCSSDAPCDLPGAQCTRAASAGATCDEAGDAPRVCAPTCTRQADCDAIAAELMCSDDSICALEPMSVPDSSMPEPDGGEPDSGEPDSAVRDDGGDIDPPIATVQVACAEGGELTGEGFEMIASGPFGENMVVAPDGTIYVTYDNGGGPGSIARIEDGGPLPILEELYNVQRLLLAADGLFVGMSDGSEVTVGEIDRGSEDITYLAREESNNASAITADGEFAYWVTDISQNPWIGRLFRSPRVPGESETLADFDGQPGADLVQIGDRLVLIALVDGTWRLHSVSTDASDDLAVLAEAPTDIARMVSDGTTLFVSRAAAVDRLGNVTGTGSIGMIAAATGEYRELFETENRTAGWLSLDETHIYWVIDELDEVDGHATRSIWRGRQDGSGQAQKLADVIGWSEPIAVHDGYLYWLSACRLQPDKHIVRIPLR